MRTTKGYNFDLLLRRLLNLSERLPRWNQAFSYQVEEANKGLATAEPVS